MKNLYIAFILLIASDLFSNELAWVDEQVEAIKPERIGVSNKEISKIHTPFIFLHKVSESKSTGGKKNISPIYSKNKKISKHRSIHLRLEAILNKSAMINGKWYKQGAYVHGYKLLKVHRKSILLSRKNKKILLSTVSRSKNIKFKIK